MDEERKVRFLVAPVLFLASLALGMLLDPSWRLCMYGVVSKLAKEPITGLIVAFVSGGITVFASGFMIGTITYALLRAGFAFTRYLRGRGPSQHEVALSKDTVPKLLRQFKISEQVTEDDHLYLGVTLDHDVLRKKREGVHNWIKRRWNAFNINCTSVTGLLLSLIVGALLGIYPSANWYIPVIVAALMFCVTARWAWKDTMGMLAFQANKLPWPED